MTANEMLHIAVNEIMQELEDAETAFKQGDSCQAERNCWEAQNKLRKLTAFFGIRNRIENRNRN
jgi:hypothetical protein